MAITPTVEPYMTREELISLIAAQDDAIAVLMEGRPSVQRFNEPENTIIRRALARVKLRKAQSALSEAKKEIEQWNATLQLNRQSPQDDPDFNAFEKKLSIRSQNMLRHANITSMRDLCTKTEAELLRIPNFGRRSLNDIKDALFMRGLHFGMSEDFFG